MLHRWTTLTQALIGGACAMAMLPQSALAAPANSPLEGAGFAEILSQVQSGYDRDAFASEAGYPLYTQADKPATFDLRHVGEGDGCYVTGVRQQNPYGTCWGFGAIAAAESSLLGSGLASDPSSLNLSEKQVTWFNATALDDPSSAQNGEGMTFPDAVSSHEKYDVGGVTAYATSLFAAGIGPTNESTTTNDGQVYAYRGKGAEVVSNWVTWLDESGEEQSGFRRVYYSEDDDWSIPEAYRFRQDYQLKESYLLPSPASYDDDSKSEAIDAIKDQLLAHRAVAINFSAESAMPGEETDFDSTLSENWAAYNSGAWPSNHVVTIVGYDDGYPKENFTTEPPYDGAWLVKNSWGSDLNDFPDNSYRHWGLCEGQDVPGSDYEATSDLHTGYFWLSYYDKTIRDPEAYSFEGVTPGVIIDQHDYMPVREYEQYTTETPNKSANVFVAKQDERLESVSFMTTTPGTTVSYQVFLLADGAANPEDGTCVVTSEAKAYRYGGYHREVLGESVELPEGQKYAVVVEQRTPSGRYSLTLGESLSQEESPGCWFKSVVNPGESYFMVDGAWRDLSDDSIRSILEDGAEGSNIDNFSIKAYAVPDEFDDDGTTPNPEPPVARDYYLDVKDRSGKDFTDLTIMQDDSKRYRASIKGGQEDPAVQPTFTWTSSDESVATIEPEQGRGDAEAILRPVGTGEADLTVDAGAYGSKTIHVMVSKLAIVEAQLADEDKVTVYTGSPYEPTPVLVRGSSDSSGEAPEVVRDVDYQVSYENNVQCGRGEVVVTGIGNYEGEARDDLLNHLSFLILPAKATITRVTPGAGSLTVGFVSQESSGISGYMLFYTEHGSSETQQVPVAKDATSAVIEGLKPGATYDISLVAYVTTIEEDPDTYEQHPVNHVGAQSAIVTSTPVLSERTPEEQQPGSQDPDEQDPNTQTYIVTFDTGGGTVLKSQTVIEGKFAITPAKPIRKGYTFKGWRLVGKDGKVAATDFDFQKTPITSNITLRAQWEETVAASSTKKSTTVDAKTTTSVSGSNASSTTSTSSSSSSTTTSDTKLPSTGDTAPATLPFSLAGLAMVIAGLGVRMREAWRS